MKTDKFEENIRQKLEGIDPPFQETDWVHLRSVLRRNGVPSIGGAVTQWLVPMMSAATVAGLVILAVWQYRTNQKLAQTVHSLKDSVTILQQAPLETPVAQSPKTDTVYITREILVPSPRLRPSVPGVQRDDDRELANRLEADPSATNSTDKNPPAESTPGRNRNRLEGKALPDRFGPKERLTESEPGLNGSESDPSKTGRVLSEQSERNTLPSGRLPQSATDRWNRNPNRYSGRQKPTGLETSRPLSSGVSGSVDVPGNNGSTTGSAESASISWEPVLNRPLKFDSSYYVENYQRRVRRIRPLATHSAVATSSGSKPGVEERQRFVHFRIGGSAQLSGGQSGYGLASEVLMGDRLTIGIGLTRLSVSGEEYITEGQYFIKKKTEFRRDYPGKVPGDKRIEILNIARSGKTWQLPVTFGYRLPVGNSFTITPSVGASFSLEAREKISYTNRMGPYEFMAQKFYEKCSPAVYNNWLVGVAFEKQWSHWVIQANPYLSSPLLSTQFSLNHTSAGMRARLLYQF
ncbi:hypothetical protein [Larkinella humicola]|uniref:Uncharacterized protein n=1 Tax=Larkinella humicola TaxID=2607654 RepID=A0A5N1JC66_9BACT|nr:hypothetical protein [Larkinella humicola]KAA9349374.1 hypothetical protein F0P93_23585 [Larkinella humicola]